MITEKTKKRIEHLIDSGAITKETTNMQIVAWTIGILSSNEKDVYDLVKYILIERNQPEQLNLFKDLTK